MTLDELRSMYASHFGIEMAGVLNPELTDSISTMIYFLEFYELGSDHIEP